jgi:hypothetical protein
MLLKLSIFIGGLFVIGFFIVKNARNSPNRNSAERGFAVVELFTSEGCSSCPPADKLIAKIAKEDEGKEVYILSYHVDYWNQLGWKDRFSDAAYSNRQRQYASWLHLNTVYTPQIVVNGKTEFIGSNEYALNTAIDKGLHDSLRAKLKIAANTENGKLKVHYETDDAARETNLVLALIQKSAETVVRAGENDGLTLSHVQIVRKLTIESIKEKNGDVIIDWQNDQEKNGWELIGFVQDRKSGRIISVAKSSVERQ